MKNINKFVMPDLTPVTTPLPTSKPTSIPGYGSGGTTVYSIRDGVSVMTLPDGSVANVDSSGNILGDIVE